ncbi:MAG: O-antigen ligase family protein [Anaerolineae bacterium]|nr:O-antigen ligase family protein [Anaerolineae bacterium]
MTVASRFDEFLRLTLPPLPVTSKIYQPIQIGFVLAVGLAIAWLPPLMTGLLFGIAIFLMLLLRWPILALYGLIPLIPFSGLLAVSVGGVRLGLMEILLAGGLLAALLRRSVQGHLPADKPVPKQFLWTFVLLLGSVGLSWLNTLSIGASLVETTKWIEMAALYLFGLAFLSNRQLKWVVITILLTGCAQALFGLYQFIFKVGPPGFLLFGGLFLRAYGTFGQPNPYAGYLGLILPLALALLIWQFTKLWPLIRGGEFKELRQNIGGLLLACLPFGLLLAGLFASQSRGAWLAFAAAAATTVLVSSRKPGLWLAVLIAGGATIGLAGAFDWNFDRGESAPAESAVGVVTQRFVEAATIATITDISTIEVTDANFATLERLAHWQAAREMWRDHPWLGVGFGNYAVIYPTYAVGRWLDPLGHAHNYLLNLGAEAGLIGIIGYAIFWIYIFRVTWYTIQRNKGFNRAVIIGCLGALVHLHIHNLFDNLYVQGMYLHLAILLTLVSLSSHPDQPSTQVGTVFEKI